MAKRKLSKKAKAIDERLAQSFDLRNTTGSNWNYGMTNFTGNDKAAYRLIGEMAEQKGGNVDHFGKLVENKSEDNMSGDVRADGSGQKISNRRYISVTVYHKDDTVTPAGTILDKDGNRKNAAYEKKTGRQHLSTIRHHLAILADPDYVAKLKQRPPRERKKYVKREKQDLEGMITQMPPEFAEVLERRGINLAAVKELGMLEAGPYIAKGKWEYILWGVDPGKDRNANNWMAEQANEGELPSAIKHAWGYGNVSPHLTSKEEKLMVGLCRLQKREEPGLGQGFAKELLWLATSKSAKKAREQYTQKHSLDLSVEHKPVEYLHIKLPRKTRKIHELLEEMADDDAPLPITFADFQSLVNKFPLVGFRYDWNKQGYDFYFKEDKTFADGVKTFRKIRKDKNKFAKLRKDQSSLINLVLDRVGTGRTPAEKRDNMLRQTGINELQIFDHVKSLMYELTPKSRTCVQVPKPEDMPYIQAAENRREYMQAAVSGHTRKRSKFVREQFERKIGKEWRKDFLDRIYARVKDDEVLCRLINGQTKAGFVKKPWKHHPEPTRQYYERNLMRRQLDDWLGSLQSYELENVLAGRRPNVDFFEKARKRLDSQFQYCQERGLRIITEKQHEKLYKPALDKLEGIFNQELLNYKLPK